MAALSPPLPSLDPPDAAADAHALLGEMAASMAGPLTRALARLQNLAEPGAAPLDANQLRALSQDIESARQVSIVGQQIARMASGQIKPQCERFDLVAVLAAQLAQRRAERPDAVAIRLASQTLTMNGDPTLAVALLNALLDWCDERGTDVAVKIGLAGDCVALRARFGSTDDAGDETLAWHRLGFATRALGGKLELARSDVGYTLQVSLPRDGSDARQLVAGAHVLVLAKSRDVRNQVRQALTGLDLIVDYVASIESAREYCSDGPPQAVVYEAGMAGPALAHWRGSLGGPPAFVEVGNDMAGRPASVDIDSLLSRLPTVLADQMARRR